MKFLVVLLALFALVWLLRGSLRRRMPPPGPPPAAGPQPMLRCVQCGLHLPRDEALPGRGGVFCGEAHRTAYERAHPAP
jgi:uncharacterized protein